MKLFLLIFSSILILTCIFYLYKHSSIFATSTNIITNGGFDSGITNWLPAKQPDTSNASVTAETSDCQQGSCLKMTPDSTNTFLAAYQKVTVVPGANYVFSAFFKTSSTHYGYINLYDSKWNQSCSATKGKGFSKQAQGTNTWNSIQLNIHIPEHDDCGENVAAHTWYVYLYGYSPVTDKNSVYYDTISLAQNADSIPATYSDLEEMPGWNILCQRYTDNYPLIPCHSDVITHSAVEKRSGNSAIIFKGTKEKQEIYSIDLPVKQNQLYKISVSLKIADRLTFNYMDLQYPSHLTQQTSVTDIVDYTKGIWSGNYAVRVDNTDILNPAIKDASYRSDANVNWFTDTAYFKTTSDQSVANIKLLLQGFDGKLIVDALNIQEADSYIDDSYFHIPVSTEFGGMKIKSVSTSPLEVQTNSAIFSFSDKDIVIKKENKVIGQISFPSSFLTGLLPHQETGNVYMENDNVLLSIGSDSVLLTKIKKDSAIRVSGSKPSYYRFDAGVIFTTDYERGMLFSPIRPQKDIASMPFQRDPQMYNITYNDADFEKSGLKFWNLTSDFSQNTWNVDYSFKKGQGFLTEAFPPKQYNMDKFCNERMNVISSSLMASPSADFRYNLAKFSEHHNIALVWMNDYQQSNTPNPPEEFCTDDQKKIVSCASAAAKVHTPVTFKTDVAGPYSIANLPLLQKFVDTAHSYGVKVIIYASPLYYYTTNVDTFLQNIKQMVDASHVDGVYYDGVSKTDPLRSLELVRKTRNMLGDKYYVQHNSWHMGLVNRTDYFRVPYEDAYADLVWNGEWVKLVDDNTWQLNYCGKNVSNTVSVPLPELRPVDYTLSSSESAALSWSGAAQIDKVLSCGGSFRVSPYSDKSSLADKRFAIYNSFDSSYLFGKTAAMCNGRTCGNGTCDINETIFSCTADCARPTTDVAVSHIGNKYICSAKDTVSQWILDNKPLYQLHFDFNGPVAKDISGNKRNPNLRIGEIYEEPKPIIVDGKNTFVFNTSSMLFGEYSGILDFSDSHFSAFAKIKRNDLQSNSQALFVLRSNVFISFGISQSKLYASVKDINNSTQTMLGSTNIDQNWHTLGIVYEKPNLSLYVDGVKEKEITITLLTHDGKTVPYYYIGRTSTSDKSFTFNGYIDDLIFTDQVLSSDQIQQYHISGMKEFPTDKNAVCIVQNNNNFYQATTQTITVTPSCTYKRQGDANCDGKINLIDFEQWRREFLHELTTLQSDFNSDNKVDMIDFDIWRSSYFNN